MQKRAAIIDGGWAGLQAATLLADCGLAVDLIESRPYLGPPETVNGGHSDRLLEILSHPQITVWTQSEIETVQRSGSNCIIDLRQHPRYVDISRCTNCGDCVTACPVEIPNGDGKAIRIAAEGSEPHCAVIAKTGRPPCSAACPAGVHAQGYIALLAQRRYAEALDLVREAMPFAGICGRVCTHPCETHCRRKEVDKAVSIRSLKRFLADWVPRHENDSSTASQKPDGIVDPKERVAVIGAGPAGLTAAYHLCRRGYAVSVFEKLPQPGGMMAVGIPAFRLPRDILEAEIAAIAQMGVQIHTSQALGRDVTLSDLAQRGYGAVFIACGMHRNSPMHISGEAQDGVIGGIDLLRRVALDEPVAVGRRVVVIGGGNVAIDCAQTCLRLGAREVTVLYRRTREEMPAWDEEVASAETEGVQFRFLSAPVSISARENGTLALETIEMKLGRTDASGRPRPIPIEGSEQIMPVETIVPAIGQTADNTVLERLGLDVDRRGRIKVDHETLATSQAGIFAGGDAVTGPKTVVEAIAYGRRAAENIDRYLGQNRTGARPSIDTVESAARTLPFEAGVDLPLAQRSLADSERRPLRRCDMPERPVAERVHNFKELALGFSEDQALGEARRCLSCGPCSECMACVTICPHQAIGHAQAPAVQRLTVDAIIQGNTPATTAVQSLAGDFPIHTADPGNVQNGAVLAGRVLAQLAPKAAWRWQQLPATRGAEKPEQQLGVVVCSCDDAISKIVDTDRVCRQLSTRADVTLCRQLRSACTPEGTQLIRSAAVRHHLSQLVVAACSCCALDQICHSCTYQRLRCKSQISALRSLAGATDMTVEFVNIREHCAWPHASDPEQATHKAVALISGAIGRLGNPLPQTVVAPQPDALAVIVGNGPGATICDEILARCGIATRHVADETTVFGNDRIHRSMPTAQNRGSTEAMVLAPAGGEQAAQMAARCGIDMTAAGSACVAAATAPGIYLCLPGHDPESVGQAAAAQVMAWLGDRFRRTPTDAAVVAAHRCRACGTCVSLCDFGAPLLVDQPVPAVWIDPSICQGCGTCIAHCPSGAIAMDGSSETQLDAAMTALLQTGTT